MSDLNLAELDRLEREATTGSWDVAEYGDVDGAPSECYIYGLPPSYPDRPAFSWEDANFIATARNQLRPLLDLVTEMGEALRVAVPNLHTHTQWREDDPEYRQVDDAFADYQRAKGEHDE